MSNTEDLHVTRSSGNVFQDLGYQNAKEHLVKAKFAMVINKVITEMNLTQVDAAKILGIDQPKVSRLMRGQLAGFSIDRLISFLISLNKDIEVNIKPHTKHREHDGFDHHFSLNYMNSENSC